MCKNTHPTNGNITHISVSKTNFFYWCEYQKEKNYTKKETHTSTLCLTWSPNSTYAMWPNITWTRERERRVHQMHTVIIYQLHWTLILSCHQPSSLSLYPYEMFDSLSYAICNGFINKCLLFIWINFFIIEQKETKTQN